MGLSMALCTHYTQIHEIDSSKEHFHKNVIEKIRSHSFNGL